MLVGSKLEVDEGVEMRKNLVKDIDHLIANVPHHRKLREIDPYNMAVSNKQFLDLIMICINK